MQVNTVQHCKAKKMSVLSPQYRNTGLISLYASKETNKYIFLNKEIEQKYISVYKLHRFWNLAQM